MERFRLVKPEINHELCVQCGNCARYCPEGCIIPNSDGYYSVALDYCKGCGVCAQECIVHAVIMVQD